MSGYCGRQIVGIDLHRRRSVLVRMTPQGEVLGKARIDNDPAVFADQIALMGEAPEVVLEATYGWVRHEGAWASGRVTGHVVEGSQGRPSNNELLPSCCGW